MLILISVYICSSDLFTEYANWWAPIIEEIVVDKAKGKKQGTSQKTKQNEAQVNIFCYRFFFVLI